MTNERIFTILRLASGEFDGNVARLKNEFGRFGETRTVDVLPEESEPKLRNRLNAGMKAEGFAGFHHVVHGSVELLGQISQFLIELEAMMRVLDYRVWLNTVCDGCNYVYNKYNPRVTVQADVPECEKAGLLGDICFTSHSNTAWMCYDMSAATDSQLRFDEDFTIPMYWIIEFLARRRADGAKTDLYFMNQYLTVCSERGLFRQMRTAAPETQDVKKQAEEDRLFRSKKIDYSVDNSVDMILDRLWNKLVSKVPRKA